MGWGCHGKEPTAPRSSRVHADAARKTSPSAAPGRRIVRVGGRSVRPLRRSRCPGPPAKWWTEPAAAARLRLRRPARRARPGGSESVTCVVAWTLTRRAVDRTLLAGLVAGGLRRDGDVSWRRSTVISASPANRWRRGPAAPQRYPNAGRPPDRRAVSGRERQRRAGRAGRRQAPRPQPEVDTAAGVPLTQAAREAGVPLRTMQRWLARSESAGLTGLARSSRADPGTRRVRAELLRLIEGLALRRRKPSVATVAPPGRTRHLRTGLARAAVQHRLRALLS